MIGRDRVREGRQTVRNSGKVVGEGWMKGRKDDGEGDRRRERAGREVETEKAREKGREGARDSALFPCVCATDEENTFSGGSRCLEIKDN